MFFCKMASKSDFDTFLAPFWMDFGLILEASGNILVTFWVSVFKVCFLMDFSVSGGYRAVPGGSPGRDYREGKPSLRGEG